MVTKQNNIKHRVEELLYELMEASAQELLARIKAGEASPQDISNAIRICKENNIDVHVREGDPIDLLSKLDDLPFEGDNVVSING